MKKLLWLLPLIGAFILLTQSCSTESTPVYQLTTSAEPAEAGSVSQSAREANEGESITITATPNEHWVFDRWGGDHTGSDNPATVLMDSDKSITALYKKREYPLSITIEGKGTVKEEVIQSKSIDYPHGTIVELTAEAIDEWEFKEWTGDIVSDENPIKLTVDGPIQLTATFVHIIEDRIRKAKEKASNLLSPELVDIFISILEDEASSIEDQVFLDSINVAYSALIDSISKYSNLDDFKDLVAGIQSNIANKTGSINLSASSLSCALNPGLGYSRSAETYSEVSVGIAAGAGKQLSARGGGGTEFIYDFVNMDRGVYAYSFCGVGGALTGGLGGGVGSNIGIAGVRKFLFNILPDQRSSKDRFEGASRSYAAGIGASIAAFIDLDLSATVGFGLEIEMDRRIEFAAKHLGECAAYYFNRPVRGGVKEVFISGSVAGGVGYAIEVLALAKGETLGTYKTLVEEGYTDFGVSNLNRLTRIEAAVKMAAELVVPEPEMFIVTGPSPFAAAMAVLYGFFDPSKCDAPYLTPEIETLNPIDIDVRSANLRAKVVDDGGQTVTNRGLCWSTSKNPTTDNNCKEEGRGTGSFSSNLTNLLPNTQYYVRAFATNNVGTAYGNQVIFKTGEGIDDVPPDVNDFMTPEDKQTLEDQGLTIHTGLSPPNVEGYYYANSLETADRSMRFMNYSYRYHDQTTGLSIKSSHISENGSDISEGKGAFIAGSGNTFSIFMESISELDQGTHVTTIESARIYSGTITSDGIKGFQFGFIVTSKKNDKDNRYMNVGDTRVIYETDGLAERVNEFPFAPKLISSYDDFSIYIRD